MILANPIKYEGVSYSSKRIYFNTIIKIQSLSVLLGIIVQASKQAIAKFRGISNKMTRQIWLEN